MKDSSNKDEGVRLLQRLAAEIASQNPCLTRAQIMEMVKEELAERKEAEASAEQSHGCPISLV